MFGLACKGLHCAGCGKGIPAGALILGVILVMVGRSAGAITAAFEELLIGAAVVVFLAAVISVTAIMRVMARQENRAVLAGRWNGAGYTELTGHYQSGEPIRQWPDVEYRPQIAPRHTIPADILSVDYSTIPRRDE